MKAVILDVPDYMIEERRRTGADRWDEVWDGVLHMSPNPRWKHQEIVMWLAQALNAIARERGLGGVVPGANVSAPGQWPHNYRIPDVVFLSNARRHLLKEDGLYVDGGPDLVIEIDSPGMESREKLPFYAEVGVAEVVIVDRDTKQVEVYRLVGRKLRPKAPGPDGWFGLDTIGAEVRTVPEGGAMEVRPAGEPGRVVRV